MTSIAENLAEVRKRIDAAAARAGRDPKTVTLAAVSKMHPAEAIREAYGAGQRCFAENYAQHLRDKSTALSDLPDIEWHFIGHLQRNKVKYIVPAGAVVQTVDSVSLAKDLHSAAEQNACVISCMIQVNIGNEAQKSGIEPSELETLLCTVESADRLRLMGIMTIPPWDLLPEETRKYFIALRNLREAHGGPARLPHLSMGMSGDFEQAVEEGATIVRVGTAVFGARN